MLGGASISSPLCMISPNPPKNLNSVSSSCFPVVSSNPRILKNPFPSYKFKHHVRHTHFAPPAITSSSSEILEEPATNVKFQTSVSLPGCSSSLLLLGTGYREKVFAIIGVKVYAAGFYVNESLLSDLNAWKGQSATKIKESSSLFSSILEASLEKSLQIVLVRDVDGKTFWDALDEAISPRLKSQTQLDESALSTFRSIFQCQSLKKGTIIVLTWPDPSKMLVSVSSDGLPSNVDAAIESINVSSALFDVFFEDAPVSPSLKNSVANGLATNLSR